MAGEFSLKGVKDLGKQRDLLTTEIERLKTETKKLEEKFEKVNEKLKEEDWKELTSRFTDEEIKKRLGLK